MPMWLCLRRLLRSRRVPQLLIRRFGRAWCWLLRAARWPQLRWRMRYADLLDYLDCSVSRPLKALCSRSAALCRLQARVRSDGRWTQRYARIELVCRHAVHLQPSGGARRCWLRLAVERWRGLPAARPFR